MYSNNNMQLIKIKRKFNYKVVIFICLVILAINIGVFAAAYKVSLHKDEILKKYMEYKAEEDFNNIVIKTAESNNRFLTAKLELMKNRTIIFNENTQDKIFDTMKRKADKKTVYLTFDDGPSKTVTPHILDILKENNVNATFFVLGTMASYYPDLVKREYDEGNYVANHGYSHVYAQMYENGEAFFSEVEKTEEIIRKAIGREEYSSHLVRFPGRKQSVVHILQIKLK